MANSLFSSLVSMLDQPSIGAIAGSLGVSERSAAQGLKSSIAAVLGGMALNPRTRVRCAIYWILLRLRQGTCPKSAMPLPILIHL